jgi:hypothetical protein
MAPRLWEMTVHLGFPWVDRRWLATIASFFIERRALQNRLKLR